ncbi:hypothetical protein ACETAC_07570 [Aceticella autotrophica]|uniref:Uncharacterized protein n=1 Tax=Aceticella autotrophica TaxID=2755338 RepID=A0A975AUL6_9THEO|nr:hypothetical protein [Aceticella autotrophica]QSZ26749.1 hypothetical protein ACETAC_07570 [Aceticella autotrophica]
MDALSIAVKYPAIANYNKIFDINRVYMHHINSNMLPISEPIISTI